MKKLKSLLIMVMAVLLTFGVAGCGKKDNKNKEYSITFMVDESVYETIKTSGNETLTFPEDPTNGNYIFGGWYRDKGVWETEITQDSYISAPLTENIKVYAKFDKPTITFMVDDATYATIETFGNEKLTFPKNPTKGNYIFGGWYKDKENWKEEVTEDTYISAPLTENIKVYAKFDKPTITFIVDDATYATIETFGNETLTFPSTPYKKDYIFWGWYRDRDIWEEEVDKNTFASTALTENITLYAKFVSGSSSVVLDDVTYSFNNRNYFVSYCNKEATSATIQSEINGIPVTRIGSAAFQFCSNLKSVTIPESVTIIGDEAFYGCSVLSDIIIPGSVTSIGYEAFYECASLSSVIIPNSVTSIGRSAFRRCIDLTDITISSGVTTIEKDMFHGCSNMAEISIPDSVTSIGESAFADCRKLKKITIGSGVTTISGAPFENCNGLLDVYYGGTIADWCKIDFKITSSNPMEYAKHFYIKNESGEFDEPAEIIIPRGITEIKACTFYGFNNVTEIEIPTGVTAIGNYAFYGCSSLGDITIPGSVKSIGDSAFYGCSSLDNITIPSGVTEIGESAFHGCDSLTIVTIGDSVISIGNFAFSGCNHLTDVYYEGTTLDWCNIDFGSVFSNPMYFATHLYMKDKSGEFEEVTEVIIPDGVTEIKKYAFYGFENITAVTISNSVIMVEKYAFYGCSGLNTATIGNSVTDIGEYAFYGCIKLTDITIPGSVKSIGGWAFAGCSKLSRVYFENPNDWSAGYAPPSTMFNPLSSSDLASPKTAAEFLRSTYIDYIWKRN